MRRLSRSTLLLAAFVCVNVAIRGFVALRPLELTDSLSIPDDAYLSLTIARNIANGLGPMYGDAFTNGFQPLYVFLAVPLFWLFPASLTAPVHGALLLLALFDTLTLVVLYRFVLRHTQSLSGAALAALAWVVNPYVISTTANGLETSIAGFFIVLAVSRFASADGSLRRAAELGAILGLAAWTRIDSWILAAIVATLALVRWRRIAPVAVLGMVALAVYAPWLVYSHHYTGELYPVSGRAVRFLSLASVEHNPTSAWYIAMVRKAADVTWTSNRELLVICGALAALGWRRWRNARALAPLALFSVALFLAYALYIFTFWFFSRYLFPFALVLVPLVGFAFAAANGGRRLAAATAIAITAAMWLSAGLPGVLRPEDPAPRGYMNVGLWAAGAFAPGTAIGSSQTGALGYFAPQLRVVNLDGVVNRACFDSLLAGENMAYIRGAGIRYVIGWDINLSFIALHSKDFAKSEDLNVRGVIPGVRSLGYEWWVAEVMPGGPRGSSLSTAAP
jgi:hypothetical protein